MASDRRDGSGRARSAVIRCERLEGRELLSTLSTDVQKLAHDLGTLHQGSNVTPAEVQALTTDLQSIAKVATKPSASSVTALKAEIKVVVAGGTITPVEAVALKKDVAAVLASANISPALAQQTANDLKTVVLATGITKADVKLIAGDVQAILADLGSLKQ